MEISIDRRANTRLHPFITVEAPSLSPGPLQTEDVCATGLCFTVHSQRRVEPQEKFQISIRISDFVCHKCEGIVAWSQKSEGAPETWRVGLLVMMPELERKRFAAALDDGNTSR